MRGEMQVVRLVASLRAQRGMLFGSIATLAKKTKWKPIRIGSVCLFQCISWLLYEQTLSCHISVQSCEHVLARESDVWLDSYDSAHVRPSAYLFKIAL